MSKTVYQMLLKSVFQHKRECEPAGPGHQRGEDSLPKGDRQPNQVSASENKVFMQCFGSRSVPIRIAEDLLFLDPVS